MALILDNQKIKAEFIESVSDDIKTYGKPALIYNIIHHDLVLNALDRQDQWENELNKFKHLGWHKKSVNKQIKINNTNWNCIIWILQPLNDQGEVHEKHYQKAGGLPIDPLASAVGYHVTGLCYLQFVDPV